MLVFIYYGSFITTTLVIDTILLIGKQWYKLTFLTNAKNRVYTYLNPQNHMLQSSYASKNMSKFII